MIRSTQQGNKTLYFVADDLGMPVSYGYATEQEAIDVAELIESSDGQASIPAGVTIEAIA